MNNREMKSNMLLMLTAAIWGFAFVAQRVGMQYVGAFTFNGVRFALGSISLIPLIIYFKNKKTAEQPEETASASALIPGIIAGSVLFFGASLQQAGLAYTTAGKAAFITGLYIVLVPLLGIFLKQRVGLNTWLGVVLAVSGLYFLSVNEDFTIAFGDLLEIIGAFFWAVHILVIDYFTKKVDALRLSCAQFAMCSALSIITALIFEDISVSGLSQAAIPILYGGLLSVGVAYTLQVVAQKHAKPSHAAIILSMEAVFAALGGALLLKENMGVRGYLGCALMFAGMLLTQVNFFEKKESAEYKA
ncbi:MAG TPA: DMT family transporter [Bacillota bacterium]|nr:DMT family transporter [Bacillota bacterium]HPL99388.1 DMT family transporter [Bacillota bacterium]HPW41294.1 DMT family transporter [Bacillota bacterium]